MGCCHPHGRAARTIDNPSKRRYRALMTTPRDKQAARLAWAVGACSLGLVAASLVLLIQDLRAIDSLVTAQFAYFLGAPIIGILGVLIAIRRPSNPIGWLLLAIALAGAMYLTGDFVAIRGLLSGALPRSWVVWPALVFGNVWTLGNTLLIFTILFFPNGRLPGPRWRWAFWALVVDACVTTVSSVIAVTPIELSPRLPSVPNPLAVHALDGLTNSNAPFTLVVFVSGLAIIVSAVVVRFRRSRGVERSQLRWFVYVVAAGLGLTALSIPLSALNAGLGNAAGGAGFGFGLIGAASRDDRVGDHAVRPLRHRRDHQQDAGVRLAGGVHHGGVRGHRGGDRDAGGERREAQPGAVDPGHSDRGDRVPAGAGAGAEGGQPAGVRAAGDAVRGAQRVLGTGGGDLRGGRGAAPDGAGAPGGHGRGVGDGVAARQRGAAPRVDVPADLGVHEALAMRNGTLPALPGATRAVEVRHQGELLGALSVSKRRGETLTPIEEKLVDDLAHQAGLVLKNVRLSADLQARLDELRASRQRLVSAQDVERRRLERNLHDGAQQHLVALKVKLGLAEMLLTRDPAKAAATLEQLKGDADEALETLRDLARGIYPPLLADKGLVVALESQARKATVPVHIDADGIGRYPQEIEAALYFCTLEALQNVQKYAAASAVDVHLHEDGGEVRVEVSDDGRGFDVGTVTRGTGLTNMEDRIDALGGSLHVASAPGSGTTLRVTVPLPHASLLAN